MEPRIPHTCYCLDCGTEFMELIPVNRDPPELCPDCIDCAALDQLIEITDNFRNWDALDAYI